MCSADDADKRIALTFDDGPLLPYTEQILDAFDEHQARATFFIRGGAVTERTSRLVLRAQQAGHEIGNHTQNHLALAGASPETIEAEIAATHDLLFQLLGSPPPVIRPPYGRGCAAVDLCASTFGYRATVLWNISPSDWSKPPPETIVSRVLAGENPDQGEVVQHCRYSERSPLTGAIVLLHDGCAREQEGESRFGTVKAVRSLLPELQSRGLELVTVSELLEIEA
jgi:peptidoglycan/xylan/chitin deacetylase (PgdA/CDA1 family)